MLIEVYSSYTINRMAKEVRNATLKILLRVERQERHPRDTENKKFEEGVDSITSSGISKSPRGYRTILTDHFLCSLFSSIHRIY